MKPDSADKPSSDKQTLSFLLRRFQQAGIEPRTDLGQNFMIDMNLQRVLLETAQIGPDDVVLEVGTGTGGLTMQMAPLAAAVVSVEVDRNLHQLAGEELFHFPNVTLLHTDVLKTKSRIEPAVLEAVQRQLEAGPGRRLKLVANLPYNVATPLISNLLALDRPPSTMTVTVQKEVADRIVARPGVKDYGGAGHLDSEPVPRGDRSRAGAVGLLAAAQGLVGLRADHARRDAPAADSRSGFFPRVRAIDVLPSPQGAPQRTAQRPEAVQQGPGRRAAGRPGACEPTCGPSGCGPRGNASASARRVASVRATVMTAGARADSLRWRQN